MPWTIMAPSPPPPPAKRGAGVLATLPEDILHGIVSRLRIKDLFLLAVTSRWWLRLFTDPALLRGLLPAQGEGHAVGARLLGFFFQETRFVRCNRMTKDRATQHGSAFAPTFFPTPWSLLGPTDRALTSFVSDDDGAFNYAEPLASRRGIVLMHLIPRAPDIDALFDAGFVFGLCNPATGERHVAPPMDCNWRNRRCLSGYAIVTAEDSEFAGEQQPQYSSRRHVFSQLLVTSYDERTHQVCLHSYSAATRSWSAPTVCVRRFIEGVGVLGALSAVVHRGAAHWLYVEQTTCPPTAVYTLNAELGDTTRVSFTKLPLAVGQTPFLCINRDGRLSVASLYGMHVEVWNQQDGGRDSDPSTASWLRARLIPIPIPVPNPYPNAIVHHREWFEFNGGAMLVLFHGGAVFFVDLEKKVVEKLMDCPLRLFGRRCTMIVPYEMDLSEFFAFQLGAVAREKPHIDDAV